MTQLTTNLYLADATRSDTATKFNIDNSPADKQIIQNIQFAATCLEQVIHVVKRKKVNTSRGYIPEITSWYRCPKLNAKVGGVPTSRHVKGLAIDFRPASGYTKLDIAVLLRNMSWLPIEEVVVYDYTRHIHVAFRDYDRATKPEFIVYRTKGGPASSLF
jgi:hypothetical protein